MTIVVATNMFKEFKKVIMSIGEYPVVKLIKNSIFYGFGTIIQRFLLFFLLPIYTKYLTPGDYGIRSLLGFMTLLISALTMCGLSNGMSRYIYYYEKEGVSEAEIVWSPLVLILIISVSIILILGLFTSGLSILLTGSNQYQYLVVLTLIAILVDNISKYGRTLLIIKDKVKVTNYINIFGVILSAVTGIMLVVKYGRGLRGAVEGSLVSSTIMCAIIVYFSIAKYKPSFSKSMLIKQLKYSIPTMGAVLVFIVIESSDRFILKEFLPLSELGIYDIGYKFGLLLMIIVGGFTYAWPPYYHKNNKNEEGQTICNNVLKIYLSIVSFFVVALSLFSPWIIRIMTEDNFHLAYTVTPWVAMAYLLKGPYVILIMGPLLKNKTMQQLYLLTFTAIVNVILNILFIPRYGREIAAVTTLISYFVMMGGAYFLMKKINPIPNFSLKYHLTIILVSFGFSLSIFYIANSDYYLLTAVIVLISYILFLIVINYKYLVRYYNQKLKYA